MIKYAVKYETNLWGNEAIITVTQTNNNVIQGYIRLSSGVLGKVDIPEDAKIAINLAIDMANKEYYTPNGLIECLSKYFDVSYIKV